MNILKLSAKVSVYVSGCMCMYERQREGVERGGGGGERKRGQGWRERGGRESVMQYSK